MLSSRSYPVVAALLVLLGSFAHATAQEPSSLPAAVTGSFSAEGAEEHVVLRVVANGEGYPTGTAQRAELAILDTSGQEVAVCLVDDEWVGDTEFRHAYELRGSVPLGASGRHGLLLHQTGDMSFPRLSIVRCGVGQAPLADEWGRMTNQVESLWSGQQGTLLEVRDDGTLLVQTQEDEMGEDPPVQAVLTWDGTSFQVEEIYED